MARIYPLDKLISRMDTDYEPTINENDFKLYWIDTRRETPKLLAKRPLLFRNKMRLFKINLGKTVKCLSGPNYQIEDFTSGLVVTIQINYKVQAIESQTDLVALALCGGNHPGAELERNILLWVDSFINEIGSEALIIEDFDTAKKQLERWILKKGKEIGLKLNGNIVLKHDEMIETVLMDSVIFPIVTTDYPKEVDLKITAEIGVLKPTPKAFRLDNADYIETLVKKTLRAVSAEELSLHSYYYDSLEGLISRFRPKLESILTSEGRTLSRFFCEGISAAPVDESVQEVSKEVSHVLGAEQNSNNKVTIAFRANMQIENAARFTSIKEKDLQTWFGTQLDDIVPTVLFTKELSQLFLFRNESESDLSLEHEIQKKLAERAQRIGFRLTALISDPHFNGMELTKPFDLQIDNKFSTNEDQENVGLQVDVRARIDKANLQSIISQTREGQDIKEDMTLAIEKSVQRTLRKTSPEDYYMNFGFSQNGDGVEEKIKKEITTSLAGSDSNFKAEVISIVLKRLDDDITEKVRELTKQHSCAMLLIIQPADNEGVITIEGEFRVDNVNPHGWHTFHKTSPSLENVKESLQTHLQNTLRNFHTSELVNRSLAGWEELRLFCEGIMQDYARRTFGLEVSMLTIGVATTDQEANKSQIISSIQAVRHAEKIQTLENANLRQLTNKKHSEKKAQISLDILDVHHERLKEIADDPISSEQEKEEILSSIKNNMGDYTPANQSILELEAELEKEKTDVASQRQPGLMKRLEQLLGNDKKKLTNNLEEVSEDDNEKKL